jgi:hypothetical protein
MQCFDSGANGGVSQKSNFKAYSPRFLNSARNFFFRESPR